MSKIFEDLKNRKSVGVEILKNLNDIELSELLYDIVSIMDDVNKLNLRISFFESQEASLRKTLYWTDEENKSLKEDVRELEKEKRLLLGLIKSAMRGE